MSVKLAKKLLSNITSVISDRVDSIVLNGPGVSSIVTLVDASVKGFTPTGSSVDLSDSLSNYDAVAVEAAAYGPSSHFYLNTAYIPKPIYSSLTELGMTYRSYLLDVFCGESTVKRIGLAFTTDMRVMVYPGLDIGANPDKLGIRNIYGIKHRNPSLPVYNTDETPVAVWDDGKTIYRKIIKLGTLNITSTDKQIERPHGIPNIDKVINVKGVFERKSTGESFVLPYVLGDNTTIVYIKGDNITILNNKTTWNSWDFYCIVEYTKI